MYYRIGTIIDRKYLVVGLLNSNELHEVYEVRLLEPDGNKQLNIRFALKILKPPDTFNDNDYYDKANLRFLREHLALKELDHPYVIKILHSGKHEGNPYNVMPYRSSLQNYLKTRVFDSTEHRIKEMLPLIFNVVVALDYIHKKGYIHRDIKPANILLWRNDVGIAEVAIINDLNVAKMPISKFFNDTITDTQTIIGTTAYCPPEAFESKPKTSIKPKTSVKRDIYSLGVTVFEMLEGNYPFSDDIQTETIAALGMCQAF